MSRTVIKNGDIVQIPLSKYMSGYGYGKYIDAVKVFRGAINLPSIIRLYSHITETPEQNPKMIRRDLLMAPIALVGIKGAHKLGWKTIDNEQISEDDKFLPDVKSGWPPLIPVPERWVYKEELGNPEKLHFAEYDNVKHLENSRLLNIEMVPFRIAMENLKLEGKNIKDIIKSMDWLEEAEYNSSYDLPPYSTLPENLKGRAIRQ